jgi:cytochrome c-type protein NapC
MTTTPTIRTVLRPLAIACLLAGLPAAQALAVDWSAVPAKSVTLAYAGQASWEWVLTQKDHEGAEKFRGGKDCKACHDDESIVKDGAKLVKGGKLEPSPIAGKPGHLPVKVQVAHDGSKLYFRLQWKETGTNARQSEYAARASLMLSDASVKEAVRAGCWAACHDDVEGMASAGATPQEKYLGASRAKLGRSGGGANLKPTAEIDQLLAAGTFLEYWTAALNPGKPPVAGNGYILDKVHAAATPAVAAEATFAGGEWTVVLSRPLAGAGPGQKTFAAGAIHPVGIAIHDGSTKGRWHYVSMEHSLSIDGGAADFVAKKQ